MSKTLIQSEFRFGQVLGHVALAHEVQRSAAAFAAQFFTEQESIDFSGHDVESYDYPTWAPERGKWLPAEALDGLGYRLTSSGAGESLVATIGVDQHVDEIHGAMLCLVLHNDGLKFRQGKVSHVPAAGDWFIFDDRANHGVKEAKGKAVFLALVMPLVKV